MSRELQEFLTSKRVSTSRMTPHNPSGNRQVERYNGVIRKGISLSLTPSQPGQFELTLVYSLINNP